MQNVYCGEVGKIKIQNLELIEVLDLLLQVLADFPHTTAELRLDYLLDLFPEIQPRSFSIASSLQVNQSSIPTIHMMSYF